MQRHLLSFTPTSLYCSTQQQGRRGAARRCPAPAPAWRTSAPRRSSSVTEPAAPATTTPTSSPSGSPRSTPGTCLPSRSHRRSRSESALQRLNIENSKQIFPEKEVRGLSTNFHIYVFVSDLYTSMIGLLFCRRKYVGVWTDPGNVYIAH